ncbi:hypothetical protein [Niveibacterium terrae]|uniref:hypothetical protein n=1 Tax=Niveibacterium terrae TaxID=3373598 RepID=UPI003A8DBE6A
MDRFTVFCRTGAGDKAIADERGGQDKLTRALLEAIDGFSTVGEISSRIGDARSVPKALEALEAGGMIETLDARMARVAGQESRWVSASGGLSVGGKPASPPSEFGEPRTEMHSEIHTEPHAEPHIESSSGEASLHPKTDSSRFKVASGSRASVFDRFRAFLGNFGHDLLAAKGSHARKIRRAVLITVSLGVLVVAAFSSVVLVQQFSTLRARVEQGAASWTGEPVKIGSAGIGFHPWPAFVLKDIKLGEGGASRVGSAWGYPDWIDWALGRPLRLSVTFADAQIESSLLLRLATLTTPQATWRLKSLEVRNTALHVGQLSIGALEGRLGFDDLGVWTEGRLLAPNGAVLETQVQDGRVQFTARAASWKLGESTLENPLLTGELNGSGFKGAQFGANWLSGAIKGDVDLDLSGPFRLDGRLKISSVSVDSLAALGGFSGVLEGRLSGPVTVEAKTQNASQLLDALRWTGSYSIADGALTRIDLLEAMRRGGAAPIAGGVTRFSKMEGDYAFEVGKPFRFGIRRLDSGALMASGRFTITRDGKIQGGVRADLHTAVERFARNFSVEGEPASPRLKAGGE